MKTFILWLCQKWAIPVWSPHLDEYQQYEQLKNRHEVLSLDYSTLKDVYRQLRDADDQLIERFDDLTVAYTRLRAEYDATIQQQAGLVKNYATACSSHDAAQHRVEVLERVSTEHQAVYETVVDQYSTLERENSILQTAHDALAHKHDRLLAEYATSRETLDKVTDRLRDYKALYADAAIKRDAYQVSLSRVERRGAYEFTPEIWSFVDKARELTFAVNQHVAPGTSGEYKRHVVLSQLIKEFPDALKQDLSIALELGLR